MSRVGGARTWVVAFLLLGTATSGCSSSGDAPATDFRSGYLSAASDYRAQFGALQSQAAGLVGRDLNKQLTLFTKMSRTTHATLEKLRALTPPGAVSASYHKLLTSLMAQESTLRGIQADARRGDQAALNTGLGAYASALQDGISLLRQVQDALGSPTSSPH